MAGRLDTLCYRQRQRIVRQTRNVFRRAGPF